MAFLARSNVSVFYLKQFVSSWKGTIIALLKVVMKILCSSCIV